MKRLVILISDVGKGSNFLAILNAVKRRKLNLEIVAVLSDTDNAAGLQYAKINKVPIKICADKAKLLPTLRSIKPDIIALAGWKQIILDEVIGAFPGMVLNLHPGLIPDALDSVVTAPDNSIALWNKGLLANKAIQNFLDQKATYAGSSVHLLTHEFDFGPVLRRTFEKIKKGDTLESLYGRLKKKEHIIYIEALKKMATAFKVLIIDGGGRGSVLAEAYSKSKKVSQLYAIPGNDFMKYKQQVITYPNLKTTDTKEIVKVAREEKIDLVDVAQDDAVAAGLVDSLKKIGINTFGPSKKAGQIEWDKAWSRNFMKKIGLPSPEFKICNSQSEGLSFIKKHPESKWFVKASGLAAGKGAIFAKNSKEALEAISEMKTFGDAGKTYLIEQCLEGEEFSAFAIVLGNKFQVIGYAQDHKRVFDGDFGPNTGGMGCSSPPKVVDKKIEMQVHDIFRKTVSGLVRSRRSYSGILYLGAMVDKNGRVWIIEFNARWGDPEAEVILPGIKNNYLDFAQKVANGKISKMTLDNKYRVIVAATSKGYPSDYSKVVGKSIEGLDALSESIKIYGAGIKKANGKWQAAGGRLFYVLGEGNNVAEARKMAYNALSKIKVGRDQLHYRQDIGFRDLNR